MINLSRTAPIFKINLLLADISWWIAASPFHILKMWARSLANSRHHRTMSCRSLISDAHESDLSDRPLSCRFRLFNNTRNVFRLVFQDVTNPVEQLPCNFDDRFILSHPFRERLKALQKHRVFTYGDPGGFDQQPSQVRMMSLGDSSHMFFVAAAVSIRDQSYVATQFIKRSKTGDLIQFCQQDHGPQCANPRNCLEQGNPRTVFIRPGQGHDGAVQLRDDLAKMESSSR